MLLRFEGTQATPDAVRCVSIYRKDFSPFGDVLLKRRRRRITWTCFLPRSKSVCFEKNYIKSLIESLKTILFIIHAPGSHENTLKLAKVRTWSSPMRCDASRHVVPIIIVLNYWVGVFHREFWTNWNVMSNWWSSFLSIWYGDYCESEQHRLIDVINNVFTYSSISSKKLLRSYFRDFLNVSILFCNRAKSKFSFIAEKFLLFLRFGSIQKTTLTEFWQFLSKMFFAKIGLIFSPDGQCL